MRRKTLLPCATLTAICASHFGANATAGAVPALGPADNLQKTPLPVQITERGACYKVVQAPVDVKDLLTGAVSIENHSFTALEDGMHYWDNGQWVESKDLVEIKGDAAVALQGPGKVVFSASTLAPVVIDFLTPEGQRLQSRVTGLYYFEEVTGRRVQIADVRESIGAVYPPNQVIYTNAFDRVGGDLVYTSTKAGMEQDIALTGNLPDPVSLGFKSSAVTLEVWTTFLDAPVPKVTPKAILRMPDLTRGRSGETVLMDDTLDFGGTWMPLGRAYLSHQELNARGTEPARIGLADPTNPDEVLVGKKWVPAGKDAILIESVDLNELNAKFKILREAAARPAGRGSRRATASVRPETANRAATFQLAKAPYSPTGVILDYSIKTGTASSFTFTNGATYWITNSVTVGTSYGTATFQPNACIKYANYAYLMLVGYSSFQTNGDPIVFTSQDDNFYGERLPNSTGNPSPLASPALSIYYPGINHAVANARFRWSRRGISMSEAQGVVVSNVVKNTKFEYSYNAIYEYLPQGTVNLFGVTSMLVDANLYVASGSYSGSFTTDYGVVTNARVNTDTDSYGDTNKNSQSECSFVVVDSSHIVAAFWDTHLSEYGLGGYSCFTNIASPRSTGWAVSTNGGTSFVDQGAVLPVPTNTTQGDAGDPVMARDTGNGRIYLLMNASRESSWGASFRLWVSTDNGQNFSLINTNIPSGASGADKPMIAVNNFATSSNYHYIYLTGTATLGTNITATMVTCSSTGGATWDAGTVLGSPGHGADICIRPNGTVYVFWLTGGPPNYLKYSWLVPGGTWQAPVTLTTHTGRTALSHRTLSLFHRETTIGPLCHAIRSTRKGSLPIRE